MKRDSKNKNLDHNFFYCAEDWSISGDRESDRSESD